MNCPKIFVVYLPQFYETEHNNRWWGKGFTDWVAVKQAESLFEGHIQPHRPLSGNYYNLLEKGTMKKQAEMALQYNIDGFVFYHYYFGDGELELEKPAENLLQWTDIDMPFCFSWAHQSWISTWSKFSGHVWGEKYEKRDETDYDGVMIKQNYGNEETWTNHFYYLLPFFKDKRYIYIDNKPVFIIYSPDNIDCLNGMVNCWRKLAKENGLKGIYLIGYNSFVKCDLFDAIQTHEPGPGIRKLNRDGKVEVRNGVRCIEYKDFWENTIKTPKYTEKKLFYTCACGYDNTPRRSNKGECLINSTPEIFKYFLVELLKKSIYYGNEMVLINAWNEWGEGMYLEPDETFGYGYLEAVRDAKGEIDGMEYANIKDEMSLLYNLDANESELMFLLEKYQYYYRVCSSWVDALSEDKLRIGRYLKDKSISTVAIYGLGDIGRKLYFQLKKEDVKVKYAIDQYVGNVMGEISVFRPEEELPQVDLVIVTAYNPDDIREMLCRKMESNIITISELIDYDSMKE